MAFWQSSGSRGKARWEVALKQSRSEIGGNGFGWGLVRLDWVRVLVRLM